MKKYIDTIKDNITIEDLDEARQDVDYGIDIFFHTGSFQAVILHQCLSLYSLMTL